MPLHARKRFCYVSDEELAAYVARADAIVLPYHRSSQSGPLHIALTAGLPVIVTAVGGLVEVVRDYAGAVLVPPQDPLALREAQPVGFQRLTAGGRPMWDGIPPARLDAIPLT
jgi:hypothetical protein